MPVYMHLLHTHAGPAWLSNSASMKAKASNTQLLAITSHHNTTDNYEKELCYLATPVGVLPQWHMPLHQCVGRCRDGP